MPPCVHRGLFVHLFPCNVRRCSVHLLRLQKIKQMPRSTQRYVRTCTRFLYQNTVLYMWLRKFACRHVTQALLLHNGTSSGYDPILHIGKTQFEDANFPMDDQGRTYHLGTKVDLSWCQQSKLHVWEHGASNCVLAGRRSCQ